MEFRGLAGGVISGERRQEQRPSLISNVVTWRSSPTGMCLDWSEHRPSGGPWAWAPTQESTRETGLRLAPVLAAHI